jgi:hypothetical protein
MITLSTNVPDIAHAIQLALAPVFLLTGIAGILNVMTGRLGRIIDRGRSFEERWAKLEPSTQEILRPELRSLERRRELGSWAINACTAAALLVCTVIAAIFAEALLPLPLRWVIGVLFTGSMAALIAGLTWFLREVHLATQTVRIPRAWLEP